MKRKKYGTVILNADTGEYVSFINSREFDDILGHLARFKKAKTVSRDGGRTYANAVSTALPNAMQISDRFHLIKNLVEACILVLEPIVPFVIAPSRKNENILGIRGKLTHWEKLLLDNYKKKLKVFNLVKRYQRIGKNAATTARETGLAIGRVYKYYSLEKLPIHKRARAEENSMLNAYKQTIIDLIQQNIKSCSIVRKLHELGCKSSQSRIREYITKIKRDGVDWTKEKFYRRDVFKLFYTSIDKIKDPSLRNKLTQYLLDNPKVKEIIELCNEFKCILKSKNPILLDDWNLKIKALNYPKLVGFVRYIESDINAVQNAILYDYSNGIAEGKIYKLKTIKRIMYGRASFELLKSKLFLSDYFQIN